MNTTFKQAATGGLAIALGLSAGCGGESPKPATSDPAQVESSITQSLDRLRALELVDVTKLVINLPAEATACYGVPCPGSTWEQPYRDERARQSVRLQRLAEIAEATAHNAYLTPRDPTEATAAVQALSALEIVEVGGLIEVKAANNGNCYNLPCPGDVKAADDENGLRVAKVFGIVDAAKRDGL
jgi:hypothetical protein